MRIALALAIVTAACGDGRGPAMPRGRPAIRLVRCAAATPMPQVVASIASPVRSELRLAIDDGSGTQRVLARAVANRPKMTFGVPTVSGALAADKVLAVLRTRQDQLGACWDPSGSVTTLAIVYKLTISPSGRVVAVDVSSPSMDANANICISRVLRTLVFPMVGASVVVTIPLVFGAAGLLEKPALPADGAIVAPWTPYAVDTSLPGKAASGAARAAEAAMRGRIAAIDGCFAGLAPTGSLRVMLEINVAGELGAVRTGGLGDARGEACVSHALEGMHVSTPQDEHVEVACDLARGDAEPWRLTPTAGYEVIDVEPTQLRHGKDLLVPGASDPTPLPVNTYLVLTRPETPGAMLQLALLWANDASAVVIGVSDDKPGERRARSSAEGDAKSIDKPGVPPRFLGIGHTAVTQGDDGDTETVRPALRVNRKTVTGCVSRGMHEAKLADPAAVSALVQRLAAKCKSITCTPTLLVAVDSDAVMRDLAEITGAARRAGFERVLFGGSELGCQQTAPAPKPRVDSGSEEGEE
ncbi:MAG: hypothetical protein ABI867_21940 [Kofleriaceae bacterium]